MSYTKNVQGQSTTFQTEPERVPFPVGVLGLAIIPIFIFIFISWIAVIVTVLIFAALAWWYTVIPAAKKYRKPYSFTASSDGILIDGKQIKRSDIHRAVIRNHVYADDRGSDVVYLHQGIGGAAAAAGAKQKSKFFGKLGEISYRVDVEANGVPHTIAGGLTEPAAFAILSDVSNVLGLSAGA